MIENCTTFYSFINLNPGVTKHELLLTISIYYHEER